MNRLSTLACILLASQTVFAQDAFLVPFKAAPLTINPAFTGMFNGNLRVTGAYQNESQTVTFPYYVTYGIGADMPVAVGKDGNYLAAGLQTVKSVVGDGDRTNFGVTASLAYHMQIGQQTKDHTRELALGIQGGYASKTVDVAYINLNQVPNNQTSQQYHLGVGNVVNYYMVNAGIS